MDPSIYVSTTLDTPRTLVLRHTRVGPPAPQKQWLNGAEHIVALTSCASYPSHSSRPWQLTRLAFCHGALDRTVAGVNSRDELCVSGWVWKGGVERKTIGQGVKCLPFTLFLRWRVSRCWRRSGSWRSSHLGVIMLSRSLGSEEEAHDTPNLSAEPLPSWRTLHWWVDDLTCVSPSAPH